MEDRQLLREEVGQTCVAVTGRLFFSDFVLVNNGCAGQVDNGGYGCAGHVPAGRLLEQESAVTRRTIGRETHECPALLEEKQQQRRDNHAVPRNATSEEFYIVVLYSHSSRSVCYPSGNYTIQIGAYKL